MKTFSKSILLLLLSLIIMTISFSCVSAADISIEDVSIDDVNSDVGAVSQVNEITMGDSGTDSSVSTLKAGGTVYVGLNTTATGAGTYDNPYNNLKVALSKNPSEIVMKEGVYTGADNFGGTIKCIIRADDGANVVLDYEGTSHAFNLLNATLKNLKFINSNGVDVIYGYNGTNVVENCVFMNNTGTNVGCIYIAGNEYQNFTVKNCTFIDNHGVPTTAGSTVYYNAPGAISCNPSKDGAPAYIIDCTFINNTGVTSGAIKAVPNECVVIDNCTFINNKGARAGALMLGKNSTVNNCIFTNNTADEWANTINWYGTYGKLSNSVISGNPDDTAIFWFGDYGSVTNSTIEGLVIHASNLAIENSNVPNASAFDVVTFDVVQEAPGSGVFFLSGKIVYCVERGTVDPPKGPASFLVSDAPIHAYNNKDHSEVTDYLKILLYKYGDQNISEAVEIFVSKADYLTNNNTMVQDVINEYNNGLRLPDKGATKPLNDTAVQVYDFILYSAYEYQNLFSVITHVDNLVYNMSIQKVALNNTVYVGNKTEFKIIVNNTGNLNLTGVYVVEYSFDDLVFDSWKAVKGNWVYSFVNGVHKWTLTDSLSPNETASFIVVFNTVSVGNKTNVIFGGSNEIDNVSSVNVTEVINKTIPKPIPKPVPKPEPTPVVNNKEATGNPLGLLVVCLFAIFIGGLKRKI